MSQFLAYHPKNAKASDYWLALGDIAYYIVDLAGFEPAASSVRWVKKQGNKEKKPSFTSNIAQNQHSISAY